MTRRFRTSAALLAACLVAGCEAPRKLAPGEHASYPIKGKVIQTLNSFDNPEAVIFTLDGKSLFVSNTAEQGMKDKGFGFTTGAGYMSRLAFQPDGTLKMVEPKLIEGLNGPLGMAVLPAKTGKFPKGTIFVCTGGGFMTDASGNHVTDASKHDPKLVGFNPDGEIIGQIKLGAGTPVAQVNGTPVLFPNAAGFDSDGNLYFSDSGNGGDRFQPNITAHPGVYMIPYSSLDALAEGKEPPKPVRFIAIPDGPNGVEVGPGLLVYVCTLAKDPAVGGAMYAIARENFETGELPPPTHKGLDRLDGVAFVGRTRIDTTIGKRKEVLVTPPGGRPTVLQLEPMPGTVVSEFQEKDGKVTRAVHLDPPITFAGPADHAIARADDGSYILVVPDPHWTSTPAGNDPVLVIRLPANFEGR